MPTSPRPGRLLARQPFNFKSVVNSHGWVELAPFRFDKDHEVLSYTDQLQNGRVVELGISPVPGGVQVDLPGRLSQAETRDGGLTKAGAGTPSVGSVTK